MTGRIYILNRETWTIGAGAAGMNATVHLAELLHSAGVKGIADHLAVATRGLELGASRQSGSDKQTYYKLATGADCPDSAVEMARALTSGGCCHGDLALVEALGSAREFYHLVQAGVPFPHDAWGAFPGYKTDHDPAGRATSAGPKTSLQMSQCLQRQAERLGVHIFDGLEPVEFVTVAGERGNKDRRLAAVICFDRRRLAEMPWPPSDEDLREAMVVLTADNFILAGGGPGELYADTVYPAGQIGLHGLALRAGLTAVNLTEWQYGLASTKFRWNVSGSYMQAIPRVFSTDAAGGDPRDFLDEYFSSTAEMAGIIFLKGYQWPFDAGRIVGGSSLIDMAVHQETHRGRRVWLDFLHNPGRPGDLLDPAKLPDEARRYLTDRQITVALPIDRLQQLNPPAIEIYAEHGIDLRAEPLEIALCAQHHNGGFEVGSWWESSLPGAFVIGEMAGTHGVKRPGGAALNAGQVGGMRAAEMIARKCQKASPTETVPQTEIESAIENVLENCRRHLQSNGPSPRATLNELRQRMTRYAAHLRWAEGVRAALDEALSQHRRIGLEGLKASSADELLLALQVEQQSLLGVAVLTATNELLARGGSRGSYCVLSDDGQEMHPALLDPRTGRPYRFKPENPALRESILCLRYNPDRPGLFDVFDTPVRPIPACDSNFENVWRQFRQQ